MTTVDRRRGANPRRIFADMAGESWRARAHCRREFDPEIFFPDRRRNDSTLALAICCACPVIEDCRRWALAAPERFGIWGGLTERQRRQMRRGAA